jgi:hypothetical protein
MYRVIEAEKANFTVIRMTGLLGVLGLTPVSAG